MTSFDFETTLHGKWILAGEHSVLKGHPAIVFPLTSKQLTLRYKKNDQPLTVEATGESGEIIAKLLPATLQQALEHLDISNDNLVGHFSVHSDLLIGVGMGASAALCVALARWCHHYYPDLPFKINTFAQTLEHLFHGKSSGLDIKGVNSPSGLYFHQGEASSIPQSWHPTWYLSASGEACLTAECTRQVASLRKSQPALGKALDDQMAQSVKNAYAALTNTSSQAIHQLKHAIDSAADCFQQWGLVNNKLQTHMDSLRQQGAIATKPTGSGGGLVLSLWDNSPPDEVLGGLIEV